MFIKFCIQVEDTYMYGFHKNKSSKSKSRSLNLRIHVVVLKEKNNKNITIPGNNRSSWQYGHYADTFRHMPMPICLHI